MKSIGTLLKLQRLKKKISFEDLEEQTKIKTSFLRAIEKEDWSSLPEFPVVIGFVKNIASILGIPTHQAVAYLKRDYNLKKTQPDPKMPQIKKSFNWGPKITFFVGTGIIILLLFSYLGFEYLRFKNPPNLTVNSPSKDIVVTNPKFLISGKTSPSAVVKVNTQPALVDEDGNFKTEIDLQEGENEIEIQAISRSGKITTIKRKITVES